MARQRTPARFSGRAGGNFAGRVRRALDGAVDTDRRLNDTLETDRDGRLGAKISRTGGLQMGPQGLELSPQAVGDKNNPKMDMVKSLDSAAVLADVVSKVNDLIFQMRRTGRMR